MVGTEFKEWLLHVTIVPWFRLPDSSRQLADGMARACHDIGPFTASFQGEAMFGPRKNRPALLIRQPAPFTDIESKVRSYLHKKRAWLVDETTRRRQRFSPHVTLQKEAAISMNDSFQCEQLYIVEQKGGHKEIVAEVRFGD